MLCWSACEWPPDGCQHSPKVHSLNGKCPWLSELPVNRHPRPNHDHLPMVERRLSGGIAFQSVTPDWEDWEGPAPRVCHLLCLSQGAPPALCALSQGAPPAPCALSQGASLALCNPLHVHLIDVRSADGPEREASPHSLDRP